MSTIVSKPDRSTKLRGLSDTYRALVGIAIYDGNEATATEQDGHIKLDALDESRFLVFRAHNDSGATITKYKLVYDTGWNATDETNTIGLADNSVPNYAQGFVTADVADGDTGHVSASGMIENVNTGGASQGDPVYLGTNGDFTLTQPANSQQVGTVTHADAVQGQIFIDIRAFQAIDLGTTYGATDVTITNTGGSDATIDPVGANPGVMIPSDKTKLDGIADNANNYSHPNHTGEVTSVGDGPLTIEDRVIEGINIKLSEVFLENLAPDAITNLGQTHAPTNVVITNTTGTDATISLADTTLGGNAGLVNNFDRIKLGTIHTLEEHGGIGDGVNNDSPAFDLAIAAAAADSGVVYLLPGRTYRLTTPHVINAPVMVLGAGEGLSTLQTDNLWQDNPVLQVTNSNALLERFSLVETGASPLNTAKGTANNVGISLEAGNNRVDRVLVNGFGFGIVSRRYAGSADQNVISNCLVTNAYSWGIEIDSCKQTKVLNSVIHNCGLDGLKIQNEYNYTCDGLLVDVLESYANGQRAPGQVGGAGNGHGIDLYDGGFNWTLSNVRCYGCYGSGLVVKGTPPGEPAMGEGTIINGQFDGALTTPSGNPHGLEFDQRSASRISVYGGSCSGNAGNGIRMGDQVSGVSIRGVDIIGNATHGINFAGAVESSVEDCRILGNQGLYGINVGVSNDGSHKPKSISIVGNVISGNYDPALDLADTDQRDAQTEWVTGRGISVFSDSDKVTVRRNSIMNCWDRGMQTQGGDVTVEDNFIYDSPQYGIYVTSGAGRHRLRRNRHEDSAQLIVYSAGTGTEPTPGTTITSGTGQTARLVRITVDSGDFGTNNAAGTMWLVADSAEFSTGAPDMTWTGGQALADSANTTYGVRCTAGNIALEDNYADASISRSRFRSFRIDSACTNVRFKDNGYGSNVPNQLDNQSTDIAPDQAILSPPANSLVANTDPSNAALMVPVGTGTLPAATAGTAVGWNGAGDLAELSISGNRNAGKDNVTFATTLTIDFDTGSYDRKEVLVTSDLLQLTLAATRPVKYQIIWRMDPTGFHDIFTLLTTNLRPLVDRLPIDASPDAVTVMDLTFDGTNFHWG